MTYDLPLPISTNALFYNLPKGGRAKTRRYADWVQSAGYLLIAQRLRTIPGPVSLDIKISTKSKCDPDNALKCCFDALVARGIIEDDKPEIVREFRVSYSDQIDGMRVTIQPAEAA